MHSHRTSRQPINRPLGAFARKLRLLLLMVVVGCSDGGPQAPFELYIQRLSRTLSVAPAPIAETAVANLPAPRDLHLEISAGSLDVLDFLALSGCAVQINIGKRNSSLGRLARDSQRLLLDLEYLQLAPACVAHLREQGDITLADTLEEAWALKRQQLPVAIFNATLGSAEYREFWKRPSNPRTDYPETTSSAVVANLEAINHLAVRWLAGDFSANNREFEILLGEVASGDGGALQQALAAQASALAAANRVLTQRLHSGPLCSPGFRPQAADILATVIRLYFVEGTQARAASLNRRYHELLPPIAALEQLLVSALPGPYQAWRQQRDDDLTAWVQAPRRHVTKLQAMQQPCMADG